MRTTPSLSLCMIVRNEAPFLEGCLRAATPFVDEVVVVDTGSTDATADIARRLGARVEPFTWVDDFSAARNHAMRKATGDYVLHLDADEWLAPGAGEVLREALRAPSFDAATLRFHEASRLNAAAPEVLSGRARLGSPIDLQRLFRCVDNLEFKGVIHESATDWLHRRGNRVVVLDAPVVHYGAAPELRALRAKSSRNLRLLQRRCALEPDSFVPRGYLALEHLEAGRDAEARAAAEEGWSLLAVPQPGHSLLRLADVRATLQLRAGDTAGALATVAYALEREGPSSDLSFLRGCALELDGLRHPPESAERRERFTAAVESFRTAAARTAEAQTTFLDGSTGWNSATREAQVLLALGRREEAAGAVARAEADAPGRLEVAVCAAEVESHFGSPARALVRLEPVLGEVPDAWLVATEAALKLRAFEDARLFFARTMGCPFEGYLSMHRKERQLQLKGRFDRSA